MLDLYILSNFIFSLQKYVNLQYFYPITHKIVILHRTLFTLGSVFTFVLFRVWAWHLYVGGKNLGQRVHYGNYVFSICFNSWSNKSYDYVAKL